MISISYTRNNIAYMLPFRYPRIAKQWWQMLRRTGAKDIKVEVN